MQSFSVQLDNKGDLNYDFLLVKNDVDIRLHNNYWKHHLHVKWLDDWEHKGAPDSGYCQKIRAKGAFFCCQWKIFVEGFHLYICSSSFFRFTLLSTTFSSTWQFARCVYHCWVHRSTSSHATPEESLWPQSCAMRSDLCTRSQVIDPFIFYLILCFEKGRSL